MDFFFPPSTSKAEERPTTATGGQQTASSSSSRPTTAPAGGAGAAAATASGWTTPPGLSATALKRVLGEGVLEPLHLAFCVGLGDRVPVLGRTKSQCRLSQGHFLGGLYAQQLILVKVFFFFFVSLFF